MVVLRYYLLKYLNLVSCYGSSIKDFYVFDRTKLKCVVSGIKLRGKDRGQALLPPSSKK